MVLYKKPPLKISFLLSISVLIEVKTKILLEKVTQVIIHLGANHDLSMGHIHWVILKKHALNVSLATVGIYTLLEEETFSDMTRRLCGDCSLWGSVALLQDAF